jgi:hypothetical protein
VPIPISQRVRRFLLGRPELKNAISQILAGLFDFLHLLANAGPSGLVATFGLIDITLNFSYQRFKSFVLLHLIVLHLRKDTTIQSSNSQEIKGRQQFCQRKTGFLQKKQHLVLASSV